MKLRIGPALVLIVIVVALYPRTASADVQVSFTVDDNELKDAVSGTLLTFSLFGDAACTTAVGNSVVAIDDVDLIERLKRFKPKNGVKPPSTARLTENIIGVSPPPVLFASVVGLGVTPVGGLCQPQYASAVGGSGSIPCLTQVGNEAYFSGCNVNVRNGGGGTGTTNGLGNLVVGYNANTSDTRTGSHNLVVGDGHTYSSYGGFIAGANNAVTAPQASVAGGDLNTAGGVDSVVCGGESNSASGPASVVSGGISNQATAFVASVSGGNQNQASGNASSVSGGLHNVATFDEASVSGGRDNIASGQQAAVNGGYNNTASGMQAAVNGGSDNTASGSQAAVNGGFNNTAEGIFSTVNGGGEYAHFDPPEFTVIPGNVASGNSAVVSGGTGNVASGSHSVVSGGNQHTAGGLFQLEPSP